jgi:phosphoribosylformylglycinamidine synthase
MEVCAIPVTALVDEAPRYARDVARPTYVEEVQSWNPAPGWLDGVDPLEALERLLASPSIASKRWVWEQYDHQVQAATVIGPGADAALLRIRGTNRGLALVVDGNGRWVWCDPRAGAALAVCEAARNLAAVGARPLAVTDCLNFGNPEKDPVYWQFVEAVRGIAAACRALGTPVVSGNVSFYNESAEGAVLPTPTIGMVGVIDDLDRRVPPGRAEPGDVVLEIGGPGRHLGASSFLAEIAGTTAGRPPRVDFDAERALGEAARALAADGLVGTMHDISGGGLAVAAAEISFAFPPRCGLELELPAGSEPFSALFGEDAARLVAVIPAERIERALASLAERGVPARRAGRVTEDAVFRVVGVGERPRARLFSLWDGSLEQRMKRVEESG